MLMWLLLAAQAVHPVPTAASASDDSAAVFHLQLLSFENPKGTEGSGDRSCDQRSACDPKFQLVLNGEWGDRHVSSRCYLDQNTVRFGHTLATEPQVQLNPITAPEAKYSTTIELQVRVKDCMNQNTPVDLITEMNLRLSGLPPACLYGHTVQHCYSSQSANITGSDEAGRKLTAAAWMQCSRGYYGRNCSRQCDCSARETQRPCPPAACTKGAYHPDTELEVNLLLVSVAVSSLIIFALLTAVSLMAIRMCIKKQHNVSVLVPPNPKPEEQQSFFNSMAYHTVVRAHGMQQQQQQSRDSGEYEEPPMDFLEPPPLPAKDPTADCRRTWQSKSYSRKP